MQESGPRTGTRFGPYELRSLLGKGGMGEVYEAYDTVKNREVAVKLLSEELAKDPTYQLRFRRESQAAARLAEPHVIPIHDWGVIDGVLFIDMRLVRGVDLRTLLRGKGPLSPARAVGIIEQIASALDAAHASNLVHRDVKPANILVTDADYAYLADFGIAHTEGDSAVTLVGMAVGSYIYMAPERFDVGPVTGRADVYSLACVLHECLTGATPFPSASMNVLIKSHLSDPPPRPSTQASGIPAALDEVVRRGMAKDPADRFPTATALARAARAALATAQAAGPTIVVRAPDRTQRPGEQAAVAPESTGELSLPAVIHPSAPTVVRPTETQFTPLPSADAPVPQSAARVPYPPEVELPPMRPFPDAHLYPETQAYLETAGYPQEPDYPAPTTQVYPQEPDYPAPATQVYPQEPDYPAPTTQVYPQEPDYPAPTTQVYPQEPDYPAPATQVYPQEPDYPAPATQVYPQGYADSAQTYPGRPVDSARTGADATPIAAETTVVQAYSELPPQAYSQVQEPHFAETQRHPGADNYPEYAEPGQSFGAGAPHGISGYLPAPDEAPTQYLAAREDGHASAVDYPPRGDYPAHVGDPVGRDEPEYGYDDYDEPAYSASRPGRSTALPIMMAVFAIVALTIGGAVAWQSFGSGDNVEPTSAAAQSEVPAPPARPGTPAPTSASSSARSTSAKATPVTLPAGAKPCGPGQASSGAFTQSATGTVVTSCAFAEEVRRAYAELGTSQNSARDAPRTVVATSPVTGRTYTMNCQPEGQLITCSGGENAVVYVY
ncbi:protein kinase domain-containing protein [Nocardia asiatica]|uniref:serine/threonine-protein kinase n=1 Tax=Nocardia asiatica TaxID=209252 RepID=UPI003EE2AFBF